MLKIMTLNLNYYGKKYGPWADRMNIICGAIQDASPDIIAFQAVRRDPKEYQGLDQAAQLARLIPEYGHILFQPAVNYPDGSVEGSAIIARIPWLETSSQELTLIKGLEDTNQRVVLAAGFNSEKCPFYFFNAHFSWIYQQSISNVEETLNFAGSFSGSKMLVGDLNTTPDSDLWKPFINSGWVDVWAVTRPGEKGYTFVEGEDFSKRIDYVWVTQDLIRQVESIEIILDKTHEGGVRASDHAGLLVTLSF
jgi:endonuclease/exonuclease/phosphatase family metal-dependent hydrolase